MDSLVDEIFSPVPIPNGAIVITTQDAHRNGWTPEANRINAQWGKYGIVMVMSRGHSWCYLVQHYDKSQVWYESQELEIGRF